MVYCGGLENRFGLTPDGGSNPSLSAKIFVSDLTKLLIWVAVIGIAFAILWWQGQIQRLRTYIQLTREELRKCSWPTWDELKGSTLVVVISIFLLGGFVVLTDRILFHIFIKF